VSRLVLLSVSKNAESLPLLDNRAALTFLKVTQGMEGTADKKMKLLLKIILRLAGM
jgi:hypothetical protein